MMKINNKTCNCGSSFKYSDCCGNFEKSLKNKAVLNKEFSQNFYTMINLFMMITNKNLNYFKVTNENTFLNNLTNREYMELKDLMLENIHTIHYDDKKSKEKLSDNDFQIYRGLKNTYSNTFIATGFIDQKLVLYDETINVKFLVTGITNPLSESINVTELPREVQVTLIPLEECITYDIFLLKDEEKLNSSIIHEINIKTKEIEVCHDFISFSNLVGLNEEVSDKRLVKIKRLDIEKTIGDINAKLIRLNSETINNYNSEWLEVLGSLRGVRSFNQSRYILKEFKDNLIEVTKLNTILDYQPLARVVEINGKVVGFISGVLSFFESGLMFQIGSFGILKKYQKKGYGKIFVELLKEDMKEYNVNYIWLLPQNDDFWLKQGFKQKTNFFNNLYSLSSRDKTLALKLSDKKVYFEDFLKLFCEEESENIPYHRDMRSYK